MTNAISDEQLQTLREELRAEAFDLDGIPGWVKHRGRTIHFESIFGTALGEDEDEEASLVEARRRRDARGYCEQILADRVTQVTAPVPLLPLRTGSASAHAMRSRESR